MHNLDIFADTPWQMSLGERAALEGVLCGLKPGLSIEIGTAEGGSLERIAAHSSEVHSFDLVSPQLPVADVERVVLHTGDSHELLPLTLKQFSEEERNVDFVLVDGDHSAEGVRLDIEDLLNSPAVASSVIVIHDTTNPTVRSGLDAVHYGAWPKLAHVDLDFVPGYMFREPRLKHELWGGLGLLIVDASRLAYGTGSVVQDRYYAAAPLLAHARELVLERESNLPARVSTSTSPRDATDDKLVHLVAELEEEVLRMTSISAHHEALWREMMDSVSWKVTAPLRELAKRARAQLGD